MKKPKSTKGNYFAAFCYQWNPHYKGCGKSDVSITGTLGLRDVRKLQKWLVRAERWLSAQPKKERKP